MRKNIQLVLQAFTERKAKLGTTCSTDGTTLYSYNLPIAAYDSEGYVRILDSYLTRTTNTHIKACVEWFPPATVKRVCSSYMLHM